MRLSVLVKAALFSLTLSACMAPLLSPVPGQLMWALLKPMVGLDPNTTNLLEQPLVKNRLTTLLGPNYDTTLSLLRTASELQQQGPLLYLMSEATEQTGADRAGLVWNGDNNQLAVLLNTGQQTQIFSESHAGQAAVWPTAMQSRLTTESQRLPALKAPLTTAAVAPESLPAALSASLTRLQPAPDSLIPPKAGNTTLVREPLSLGELQDAAMAAALSHE